MPNAQPVGFVEPASGRQSDVAIERHPEVVATIAAWAASIGYDAAIWTALASNFDEPGKGGEPFSVTAAIGYLERSRVRTPPSSRARWPISATRRPRSRRRCATKSPSAGLRDPSAGRAK